MSDRGHVSWAVATVVTVEADNTPQDLTPVKMMDLSVDQGKPSLSWGKEAGVDSSAYCHSCLCTISTTQLDRINSLKHLQKLSDCFITLKAISLVSTIAMQEPDFFQE